MQIEELLARLEGVKANGAGKWIARCPAHADRSPSLSIKESDGTILAYCFAGCDVESVCGAIGIEVHELFPPRENEWKPGVEKPMKFGGVKFTALDALKCLAGEGAVLALLAADLASGQVLSPAENDRLVTAASRIAAGLEYLEGQG